MTDFKALAQKLSEAHRVWVEQEKVMASSMAWHMVHEVMDVLEAEAKKREEATKIWVVYDAEYSSLNQATMQAVAFTRRFGPQIAAPAHEVRFRAVKALEVKEKPEK